MYFLKENHYNTMSEMSALPMGCGGKLVIFKFVEKEDLRNNTTLRL